VKLSLRANKAGLPIVAEEARREIEERQQRIA
jgi:hypothetical protein